MNFSSLESNLFVTDYLIKKYLIGLVHFSPVPAPDKCFAFFEAETYLSTDSALCGMDKMFWHSKMIWFIDYKYSTIASLPNIMPL